MLLGHPGFYSVVAEVNGEVAGSNVLDERSTIPGVGPVTVDPAVQNRGVGRVLMQDVTRRGADRGAPGIRLLQAAYHSRSLSLYAKHDLQVRDLLARMQGTHRRARSPGYRVRRANTADVEVCTLTFARFSAPSRSAD